MKIFISYCSADQAIKDEIFARLNLLFNEQGISHEIVAMDTHCAGNWAEWMVGAVKMCDIVIPVLTNNSMYVKEGDGRKRVFEETRIARDSDKVLVPYATCVIPDEMLAHIGSYSATGTIGGVIDKVKIIFQMMQTGEKITLRENASLAGFRSAQTNKNFVGRMAEISWLDDTLNSHNVAILKGEGGIGKTTLAEYFFQSHKDKYTGAYIVDASNGVRSCITNMPFKTSHIQDEQERYVENKKYLCSLDSKTIIILDNCDVVIDGEDLDDIIDKTDCKIIITSRKGDDGRCVVESYNVGRMDNDDLLALVRKHNPDIEEQNGLSKEETDQKLIELFKLVDGHTLTIEMASAIMESAWVGIDEIMESLLECEETARTRKFKGEETIMANLGALYDFAKLTPDEKRVLNVLCLVCPTVGIDLGSIKKMLELKNISPIKSLVNGTFARRDEHSSRLSMHPLFADVYYKKEEPFNEEEYEKFVDFIFDLEYKESDIEHTEKSLNLVSFFCEKRSDNLDYETISGLLQLSFAFLFALGRFTEAREYADAMVESVADMTDEEKTDNEVWTIYTIASGLYIKLTDFETALNLSFDALRLLESAYGDEPYMEFAQVYNAIGCVYKEIGNNSLASVYFNNAVEICEAQEDEEILQSEEYIMILANTYGNLGISYAELGEFNKALEYQKKGIETHKLTGEGSETSPRIALAYNNMGQIYSRIDDDKKALELYAKSKRIMETIFKGEYHPDLALVYNNIGQSQLKLGSLDEAIENSLKSVEMFEEVYKDCPMHAIFVTAYNNLAEAYRMKSLNDEALEYYGKALEVAEVVYEDYPEHPTLATLYANMALLFDQTGKSQEAIEYFVNSIVIFEAIHEENPINQQLMAMYYQGTQIFRHAKMYELAIEYKKKYIEIYEQTSSTDKAKDQNLAMDYYDMAYFYRNLKNFDKSLEYAKKSVDIYALVNKEVTPCPEKVANLCEEVGYAFENKGIIDGARAWYKASYDFYKHANGGNIYSKDIKRVCFRLGLFCCKLGQFEDSKNWFLQYENICVNTDASGLTKALFLNLKFVFEKLGDAEMAQLYDKKAKEME